VIRVFVSLVLGLVLAASLQAQEQTASGQGAILRGLDKVNGQTLDIQIPRGGRVDLFGLTIDLADCRYPADNPTGDAFAFLTILDSGQTDVRFQGWMIASSPALNALDHSRYDVWVLRCITS
jgi:hypothetical protein